MSALTLCLCLLAQVAPTEPAPAQVPDPAATAAPAPAPADPAAQAQAEAEARAAMMMQPIPESAFPNLFQRWLLIYGEPGETVTSWWGPFLTWLKVVSLVSLVGWIGSWVVTATKERPARSRMAPFDYVGAVGLLGILAAVLIGVLQRTGRIGPLAVSGQPLGALMGLVFGAIVLAWIEKSIWSSIRRFGSKGDAVVLVLAHVALAAGVATAFSLSPQVLARSGVGATGWRGGLVLGFRLGATFMGYVVLARVVQLMLIELAGVRFRRLYSIGLNTVVESHRRMGAPAVVLVLFGTVLAFTHWFLPQADSRQVELSRNYVTTLTFIGSFLLLVMICLLTPLSLPQDIQFQTIFTIVSKPVKRLELVWGRLFGFMALVTALLVVFGVVGFVYLNRNVERVIAGVEAQAKAAREAGNAEKAQALAFQAEQMRTRMSARVPVKGSLTFVDSLGVPRAQGIDVGMEMESRTHIEGATQAKAQWKFGAGLPHPVDRLFPDPNRRPLARVDRPVPIDQLLVPGTIEEVANRALEAAYTAGDLEARRGQPGVTPAQLTQINTQMARARQVVDAEVKRRDALIARADDFERRANAAEDAGRAAEAASLRSQSQAMHSPPFRLEMTFNVYRTTKGDIGEPVFASVKVINPFVAGSQEIDTFPIREYYTNFDLIPARVLVGSRGYLDIEVQCLTSQQYLGMTESDLFIMADSGNFYVNYAKGLAGIWLQALVLTAIGVFAGTFLSWPVALLLTIGLGLAGTIGFGVLRDLSINTILGGGPFESAIRVLTHENQMSDLAPTLGVVVAKAFDSLVVPVLTRLVYIVPNFSAVDVSATVADGFAVTNDVLIGNVLLALGYAIPFSVAGYFILKHREVAA